METLAKHFDTALDTPDGIKKLRELILTLAMKGKLVPQDPKDQPASELLKDIEAEKARLVKEGKIKKQEALPVITPEAMPYELPKNWEWCRLSEIGIIGSSSRVHQKDWTTDGIPFYRAREIVKLSKNGFVENELFITEKLYKELSKEGIIPETNDLMITGVGTIGVPYIVKEKDRFYFKDASVLIFKNHYNIYPYFLFQFFSSPYWINEIHSKSMGTTVHTLTIGRANEVLMPLPPLAEQKRIVEKIDQLMSLCDKLEAERNARDNKRISVHTAAVNGLLNASDKPAFDKSWNFITRNFNELYSVTENVAELKKAILQLAVMGKLVEQNKNDQPAGELLKMIQADASTRLSARVKKQVELPPIKPEEIPYQLPEGWVWCRLGEVSNRIHYGYTASADHSKSDIRLLRITDIQNNTVNWESVPGCDITNKEFGQYKLSKNDILIARTGGTVGKSYLVDDINVKAVFASYLIRVIPSQRIFVEYLKSFIECPLYWKQLYAKCSGTGQPNVNGTSLNTLILPLPPLAEQKRIVAKIDQLMELCNSLEQQIKDSTEKRSRVLGAVLARV